MRLYNVHTLEEACHKIQNRFQNFETESIAMEEALGRILAEDVHAEIQVPTFRRSTVDGYAVHASDTTGASETMPMLLDYIGTCEMGQDIQVTLGPGQALYVPTGGMVPQGATAMVMIEYTDRFSEEVIGIMRSVNANENIVKVGDDVKSGDLILKKGTRLSSRHIGVLAATGHFKVTVYKGLKVSVISTGDELITTQQNLHPGQVFDINTHTLSQHVKEAGMEVVETHVLKDDKALIKSTMTACLKSSDVVLISGGSSVGHKDYTADIIDELGEVMVHGLAIKPGKPTIVGCVDSKLVLGLPGHPVSALIVLDQVLRMYLGTITQTKPVALVRELTKNIHSAPGKATFVMVQVDDHQVTPILGKSSMITTMSLADGYIQVPEDVEGYDQGQEVTVHLFH